MHEVKLPRISDEHDESSIILWFKQEGDYVEKNEALLEVQTEKAVSQIEAETGGILEKILVNRGDAAQVGDVLCVINTDISSRKESGTKQEENNTSPNIDTKDTFVRIAPRLRKLAKELNVDLTKVSGTGQKSQITENDIRDVAENAPSKSMKGQGLSNMRKVIAERMKESLQTSAQLTETALVDVTELSKMRQSHTEKLSWKTWIVHAVIKALQEHPYMNGTFKNEMLEENEKINLGIAVDTDEGLLVPVIKDVASYELENLEKEINRMEELAKSKKLSTEQMSEGTFTITSLGGFGIQFFTPIINPPELAILGIGEIEEYLYRHNENILDGLKLPLSLTIDHQVIDGAPGARFLQTLVNKLKNPEIP